MCIFTIYLNMCRMVIWRFIISVYKCIQSCFIALFRFHAWNKLKDAFILKLFSAFLYESYSIFLHCENLIRKFYKLCVSEDTLQIRQISRKNAFNKKKCNTASYFIDHTLRSFHRTFNPGIIKFVYVLFTVSHLQGLSSSPFFYCPTAAR